jgi:2-polyprenyl-6-methoxyphenol hydroxylase-like FAD-dependent oxidoreductase
LAAALTAALVEYDYDVAIAGFGPVGQLLAGLFGLQGLQVGVFERWQSPYALPRACVIDDEVMRMLQAVGVAEAFERVAVKIDRDYVWTNAAGQVLLSIKHAVEGISGWGARHMFFQPELEQLLEQRVQALPTVHIQRGCSAIGLSQDTSGVELEVEPGALVGDGKWHVSGGRRKVRARFLVGADGANSVVRYAAGIDWLDLGFRADWLVIDFRPNDPDMTIDMPMAGQLCDPQRPVTMMRHIGRKHARWEMMLLPGENAADITRPERIWELLSRWVRPQDGEVIRRAVYTFRSGVAAQWRCGRVLLAGDAAHLMPPFLGQGLCSGFRDAMALAWRLSAVLKSKLPDSVLDSYTLERREHVEGVIALSVALGKVVCVTDPAAAAARDAAILSGAAPPLPVFPRLRSGLLHRDASGEVVPPAGTLALQALVSVNGLVQRFDDAVGRGWVVLSCNADPDAALTAEQRAFLDAIGALRCHVGAPGSTATVLDVESRYHDYLLSLGALAIVVRPDNYLYGVARTWAELLSVIDELLVQCNMRTIA